jgi:hypothetical protein
MIQGKMRIGPHNAEELLFTDAAPWNLMPEMRSFRDQWALSRMSPELRPTGRRAILEFLEASTTRHEGILSAHFGSDVTIDKASHKAVRNVTFGLEDHPPMDGTWDYSGFGCHRDGDNTSITFWR